MSRKPPEIHADSEAMAYSGVQGVYTHASTQTGTEMTFSAYIPEHEAGETMPVLWYLSGLTCSHANVTEKGEFRRACVGHRVIFVAPDTGPRGQDVPDLESYDFGTGAGFYVDATLEPWAQHYRMRSYVERIARSAGSQLSRRHVEAVDHGAFHGKSWRIDDWPPQP